MSCQHPLNEASIHCGSKRTAIFSDLVAAKGPKEREGEWRDFKPRRISNKFTEIKEGERERSHEKKTSRLVREDVCYFSSVVLSVSIIWIIRELHLSLIKPHALAFLLRILTLSFKLNSLGIATTESMQLITANESLFEQKRRGVH